MGVGSSMSLVWLCYLLFSSSQNTRNVKLVDLKPKVEEVTPSTDNTIYGFVNIPTSTVGEACSCGAQNQEEDLGGEGACSHACANQGWALVSTNLYYLCRIESF